MEITLYTTSTCPHCQRAKALLDEKGLTYTNHEMDTRVDELNEAKAKWNHPSVPIVIVDGKLIGGNSELQAFNAEGKLSQA